MRILQIEFENFGVFRGKHVLNFENNSIKSKQHKPIILIFGHNGSGKTTLFQLFSLAIFGRHTFEKFSDYKNFLITRFHKWSENGELHISKLIRVQIIIEVISEGQRTQYKVERKWENRNRKVGEELILFRNNEKIFEDEGAQNYLIKLFPAEYLPLWFLDAEKFDENFSIKIQNEFLLGIFNRIFGIDIVEKLSHDIKYSILRNTHLTDLQNLSNELTKEEKIYQNLSNNLRRINTKYEKLLDKKGYYELELEKLEEKYIADGGLNFEKLPELQNRLKELKSQIDNTANKIKDLASELLPFTLCPELNLKLIKHLKRESKIYKEKVAHEILKEKTKKIEKSLNAEVFWTGINLDKPIKQKILKKIKNILRFEDIPDIYRNHIIIHQFTESEREHTIDLISKSLYIIPNKTIEVTENLRRLKEEYNNLLKKIKGVPDDDYMRPLKEKILHIKNQIFQIENEAKKLLEKKGSIQFQVDQQNRKILKIEEQLINSKSEKTNKKLAKKTIDVLKQFRNILISRNLQKLSHEIINIHNSLCRKEQMVSNIQIKPSNFSLEIQAKTENSLHDSDFSSGEKQVYLLSFLAALREISSKDYPLLIDMPFARLDDMHRMNVIHRYFPNISQQVILFVNDSELNIEMFNHLKPFIYKILKLQFFKTRQHTVINELINFNNNGIIIYIEKGENGQIGNSKRKEGRISPEYIKYGKKIKKFWLPGDIKRLVLFDPFLNNYDWKSISVLEHLVDEINISESIKMGKNLYDIWKDKWTQILKNNGYESIALNKNDGPVEFVLDVKKLVPFNEPSAVFEEKIDVIE